MRVEQQRHHSGDSGEAWSVRSAPCRLDREVAEEEEDEQQGVHPRLGGIPDGEWARGQDAEDKGRGPRLDVSSCDRHDESEGEHPQQPRQCPRRECRIPRHGRPGGEQQVEERRVPIVAEGVDEPSQSLVGQGDRLRLVQPERGIGDEPQEDPDEQRHHDDDPDRGAENLHRTGGPRGGRGGRRGHDL